MPRLIEYVSVGFCSGYGDGDYRVSAAIADFTSAQMNELRLAMNAATYCMEDMWRNRQQKEQAAQEKPTKAEP